MSQPVPKPSSPQGGRPPLLLFVAGLVALAGFTALLGYAAIHNGDSFRNTLQEMQQSWNTRMDAMALPNQAEARSAAEVDSQYLSHLNMQYNRLHHLLGFSIAGLGVLILLAFAAYRFALVIPLRNLAKSCHEVAKRGFRGPIWGQERADLYGNLARSISELRRGVSDLADMAVEGPDGVSLVRFSGRGAAVFNTLISDLQAHIRKLQEDGAGMRERIEQSAGHWEKKAQFLGDTAMQTSANLHDALEASRQQLQLLHDGHRTVQDDARDLVDRFRADMLALNEIAAATGQRVAQTLSVLNASDRDLRRATQQNLQASETFSKHASDLTEKLIAATELMRASGKVMAETTEAARTRFLEAVKSVETHDQTLKAFLTDTAGKTDKISALYDSLSSSAQRVAETVGQFDTRMGEFDKKSNEAFTRIAMGANAMDEVSGSLKEAHGTMNGSLESMRSHTEMLARILVTIRDEYAGTMETFRVSMQDAVPAIGLLKEAGQHLHGQMQHEWTQYAQQSRELFTALEQDVRSVSARTNEIAKQAEELIVNVGAKSRILGDSAGRFDLQVASFSERLEHAAATVMHSNEQIANSTTAQIGEIHGAVSEMAQRLSILTQLTSTLGAVAGQLGQLVPSLSEAKQLTRNGAPAVVAAASPAMAARFEQLNIDFTSAIKSMRGEFDGVRSQITRWVETISGGYQRLAQQINGIDRVLEEKLSAFAPPTEQASAAEIAGKLAPSLQLIHETLAEEASFSQRMVDNIENLRAELDGLRAEIQSSSGTLRGMNDLLADGFDRLQQEDAGAGAVQGQSELVEKLEKITQELNLQNVTDTVNRLNNIVGSLEKLADHAAHGDSEDKAG
ncbi:MAG: hypothetical protein HY053_08505 [Proteobacteria bacterium]|nr:hypothetical protein [Pseudomonadota bacterium]